MTNYFHITLSTPARKHSIHLARRMRTHLRILNDNKYVENYRVTGMPSLPGCSIRYYRDGERVNLTAAITGEGWETGDIYPGEVIDLWVQVTATSAILVKHAQAITLTLQATGSRMRLYRRLVVMEIPIYGPPDVLIRAANDSSFIGGMVFGNHGIGQTRSQTVSAGDNTQFVICITNPTCDAQTILVQAPAVPAGWQARFLTVHENLDITFDLIRRGWEQTIRSTNENLQIRLNITADDSLDTGSRLILPITACLKYDPSRRDVVHAVVVVK